LLRKKLAIVFQSSISLSFVDFLLLEKKQQPYFHVDYTINILYSIIMKPIAKKATSVLVVAMALTSNAFVHHCSSTSGGRNPLDCTSTTTCSTSSSSLGLWPFDDMMDGNKRSSSSSSLPKQLASLAASAALVVSLTLNPLSANAENELSDKYGGKGFDSSLVDQTCLVDKCSLQAKACLADDPSCRKGLTCTAKCLGDNSCITGCMARYGNKQLDQLLKCTVEDNECIKIAILPGGADKFGEEPRAPKPTVTNFDYTSLQGTWYKVVGFNPNYDCYACQRNTFALPEDRKIDDATFVSTGNKDQERSLYMGVEFSMPHLLPDGSPPPPKQVKESMAVFKEDGNNGAGLVDGGFRSIGLNEYNTNEVMVFDDVQDDSQNNNLVFNEGKANEARYSRTAHSEGEMFGLSKLH
jgi:hypothetical protein